MVGWSVSSPPACVTATTNNTRNATAVHVLPRVIWVARHTHTTRLFVSEASYTNQWNKGLISVDRRAEPTLILTIPCSLFKSSTNDLSLEIFEIDIAIWYWTGRKTAPPIGMHVYIRRGDHRHIPSMDSDLEAFSHNPTDGSFAPLPFQASAWTNYLNRLFLSY